MGGILGACDQGGRLHHMGVGADDGIEAHVAYRLGNGTLIGIFCQLVFRAPVDKENRGLRPIVIHLLLDLSQLRIESVQVLIAEIVHKSGIFHGGVAVKAGFLTGHAGGVGVAHHAHLNTVYVLHNIPGLLLRQPGAQSREPCRPDSLHGPQKAWHQGVVAVVVGGEQGIQSGVFGAFHDVVGAVKIGPAAVGHVASPEGGFQIGNGKVRGLHIIAYVAEHGGKIIGAVRLLRGGEGVEDRAVHQQVSLGADGSGGYHMLRLGESGFRRRFRGLGWRFRGDRGGNGGLGWIRP